jgi:hypothetical protein
MTDGPISINIDEARKQYLSSVGESTVNQQAVNDVLETIGKGAKQVEDRASSSQARSSTAPTAGPDFDDPTPLSREMVAALADVGVSGYKTHGEVRGHVRGLTNLMGLREGDTKSISSRRGLTDKAEEVMSRLGATGQRSLSGAEASLLDEAHTAHLGVKHLMRNDPSRGGEIVVQRTERDPSTSLTEQSILSQSLDVTPDMQKERQRTEPTSVSQVPPVSMPPGTIEGGPAVSGTSPSVRERTRPDYTPRSGRPLVNLPAVPKHMTEGLRPGQVRYRTTEYNRNMKERSGLMDQLSTERVARVAALDTGAKEAVTAGLMWSFDPGDGGWAHRPMSPPIGSAPTTTPETPSTPKQSDSRKQSGSRKNPPIPLTDMVGAILQGEKDILDARSKYPEQDNPIPGYR